MDKNQLTTEALATVLEWTKQGGAFIQEQAPLVVQEIVVRGRVTSTAMVVISMLSIVSSIAFVKWVWEKSRKWDDEEAAIHCRIGSSIVAFCLSFGMFITFFIYAYEACTAWFAPRLYVLEQLQQLLK